MTHVFSVNIFDYPKSNAGFRKIWKNSFIFSWYLFQKKNLTCPLRKCYEKSVTFCCNLWLPFHQYICVCSFSDKICKKTNFFPNNANRKRRRSVSEKKEQQMCHQWSPRTDPQYLPVAIIILLRWTDGRTETCAKAIITTGRDWETAAWINNFSLNDVLLLLLEGEMGNVVKI